jgi:dihydrofolate reductase
MISFVVAMDRQRGIGLSNKLPWHLPADLAYFRKLTTGHAILMGRKTYESIGKPLPNRVNWILTRNPYFEADGCKVIHTLEEVLQIAENEELFVIGGAEIFQWLFPFAKRLYITWIDHEFEVDTTFPIFDEVNWQLESEIQGKQDEANPYLYWFRIFHQTS